MVVAKRVEEEIVRVVFESWDWWPVEPERVRVPEEETWRVPSETVAEASDRGMVPVEVYVPVPVSVRTSAIEPGVCPDRWITSRPSSPTACG